MTAYYDTSTREFKLGSHAGIWLQLHCDYEMAILLSQTYGATLATFDASSENLLPE